MSKMRSRHAMTLIEMLFGIFMATILTGMLAAVIYRLRTADDASVRRLEATVALAQLGEQLRRDAHAAAEARVELLDGQPRVLRLPRPDGSTVQYTLDEWGVERLLKASDQVVSRERFNLPEMRCQRWQDQVQSPDRVALVIGRLARRGDDLAAVKSTFTIEAALPRANPEVEP